MKLQYPILLLICLALAIYKHKKSEDQNRDGNANTEYRLTVERGAFHYDTFVVTTNRITYIPESSSNHELAKYNDLSEKQLDSIQMLNFFAEIHEKGFWKLKNRYETTSSCTSELIITLETNGRSKTVICDDYARDCPGLVKYIDKKVVEWEGNDLKRIYLPG